MRAARPAIAVLVALALAWIGWITIQATRVDKLAETDPEAALRLDPDHPQALIALAWKQLGRNEETAAMATARHLLQVEPGQGDAFAVLALAAARRGDADAAQLAAIALQRAPRNRDLRTQQAAAALKAGDLATAMAQIDALLRLTPSRGMTLYPALAQQAQDPRFADVLAATLARDPPWRRAFLATLNRSGTTAGVDNLYARLQQHGELSKDEVGRWLDRMIADGRWGEAFAQWAGTLGPAPGRILPVRNGGFESDPTGLGFGWRNDPVRGVFTSIDAGAGTGGSRAAHLHFIGETARGNLRQALLLAPGKYRLSLRARTEFLRSDQGLQWIVRCDKGATVATIDGLEGSFGWRQFSTEFEVPAGKCPGQWLELTNPAVAGSARQVGGDLWIDDVAITPTRAP